MRIFYDKDADVLAILLDDAEVEETKNIAPGVEVDFDSSGRVLAMEILGASKTYDLGGATVEAPDPYYSLTAAATFSGLSATTLRHQTGRGALLGTKFGRNWMVHGDHLDAYIRTRSRKGKALIRAYCNSNTSPQERATI